MAYVIFPRDCGFQWSISETIIRAGIAKFCPEFETLNINNVDMKFRLTSTNLFDKGWE